jgi:hypothetical protein
LVEILTLEFVALIVGVACIAGGISISLAQRSRKPRMPIGVNPKEISEQKTTEVDSNDLNSFSRALRLPASAEERSQEVEVASPSLPSTLINTFQVGSDGDEAFETPSSSSYHVESEIKISIPEGETFAYKSQNDAVQSESTHIDSPEAPAPFEYSAPSSPRESEVASSPEIRKDQSSSKETTVPLALPTDSAALQNISQVPLPIGVQGATANMISYGTGNNSETAPHAYCVKCKAKKQIRDPTSVIMKNGRPATSGFCCDCGTRVFRIGRVFSS